MKQKEMWSKLASGDDYINFASGAISFVIDGRKMKKRIEEGPERARQAAWITAQSMAPEVENYMKINAPWTDRTGNARNGLAARAYREGSNIGIDLFGQVEYQVWLETRFEGQFAIIQPTIDAMSPVVMKRYERLMDRM